jgi:hypothetical protein
MERIPQAEVSQNAERIARELGLRGAAGNILPGKIVQSCHRILAHSRDHPEESVYGPLTRACQGIRPPHKRQFLTCLILLDRLWLVRAGSTAARDVVRLIRESFHLCDQPSFKAILHDELLEKQWSSFPLVRQTAAQIIEIQKVTEAEIHFLRDPRAFPDIRTSIARRVLLHRQQDRLPQLLEYLIEASENGEGAEEQLQAEQMIAQLREFGMSVVLAPLFQAYVNHFSNQTVRGYLMRALSSFGESLVPQLESLYRADPDRSRRLPIVRLLRQMISRGHPVAARALGAIILQLCAPSRSDSNAEALHPPGTRACPDHQEIVGGSQERGSSRENGTGAEGRAGHEVVEAHGVNGGKPSCPAVHAGDAEEVTGTAIPDLHPSVNGCAAGVDLDEAAEHLLKGARERAARGVDSERTLLISEYLRDLSKKLACVPQATVQQLSRDLASISWDSAVTQELVERVVSGVSTLEERQQLRWGGSKAVALLTDIIQDEHRSDRQRLMALNVLPTLFGNQGRSGPEELLWRIYRHSPNEEMRLGALECLASLELQPPRPEEARPILYEDFHNGNPQTRKVIIVCWPTLFPHAPPPAAGAEKTKETRG